MNKQRFDALLTGILQTDNDIADILFVTGRVPLAQIHGTLKECNVNDETTGFTEEQIREIAVNVIDANSRLLQDFEARGSCDCSYDLGNLARFRVNVFKQNGRHSIVMRKLPAEIPTIEGLGLPPVFREMIRETNGIIFVTGATGSGKTTTLAALLNELNNTKELHVVTLEDPIEYSHPPRRCVFNQRELGKDFPNFAEGLRAALRQAPKVILVGEIRDRETMEIALTASETGHVVFATLHTINAGQTINRILGLFSKDEEQQVRQRLADTLRYIASQRLVEKVGGGRLLVTEVMGSSLRTREALLYGEGENSSFIEIIEAGTTRGWHSFDQGLLKAFDADLVTEDCALIFSTDKNKMRREIDQVKKLRDRHKLEGASGLTMQTSPLSELRAAGGAVPVPSQS
jgi:twitching motility protein PilT